MEESLNEKERLHKEELEKYQKKVEENIASRQKELEEREKKDQPKPDTVDQINAGIGKAEMFEENAVSLAFQRKMEEKFAAAAAAAEERIAALQKQIQDKDDVIQRQHDQLHARPAQDGGGGGRFSRSKTQREGEEDDRDAKILKSGEDK